MGRIGDAYKAELHRGRESEARVAILRKKTLKLRKATLALRSIMEAKLYQMRIPLNKQTAATMVQEATNT